MAKCTIRCFGVGDGWPCADRNHSSYLYRFGKTALLIDCGEPISRSFKATGLSYDLIDRIFISHLHSDHIGGFFMLMQGFWLERRRKELPVIMPAEGIQPVQELLHLSTVFPELLEFELRFEAMRARRPVMVGKVRVTPFATSHLDQLRRSFQKRYPYKFESFSFLLEAGRLRIGHSADIGRPEDLEPLLQKPLDVLVCELAHFKAEDLFTYLKGRKIKRIIFTHLGRPYWGKTDQLRQTIAQMLPGVPYSFAGDDEEISVC